jgi:hypothetical protein
MSISTDEARSILLWGAVGGSLPTLGKIAGTYGANFDAPLPNILGVVIAVTLYSLIGSVVSRAVGNPDVKQALFAGIAAPAIVVSVITGASDGRTHTANANPAAKRDGYFISSAYAQTPPARQSGATRQILIETQSTAPVTGNIDVYATVPAATGNGTVNKQVGTVSVNQSYQRQPVEVPENATSLTFSSGPASASLPNTSDDNDRVQLKLTPQPSGGKDLFWALGGKRQFDIGGIDAKFDPFK